MATAAKSGPQDMPPKGGYAPYQIERVPLRTVIGGRTGLAIFLACTYGGLYLYGKTYKRIKMNEIEMRSARHALTPLMEAERDRAILKHMIRLREEEADLMKNFPGWEVGKFFSEPLFSTIPENTYIEPTFRELTVFSNPEDYKTRIWRIFMT